MRRLLLVCVAVVLPFVLVLGGISVAGGAETKRAKGKPAGAAKRAPAVKLGRELLDLRTSTSKTFLRPGGGRVAQLYASPVHYEDAKGRWLEIDSSLRRQGSRFVNRAGRYGVAMPADIGTGPVRVRKGTRWVEFSLRGARGPARVRGAEARYADALPGVDVAYKAQGSSVKETMVLAGPSAQRSFTFDLNLSSGLRPRALKGRGLVVKDGKNRTRMAFAAPWMVDAAGRQSSRVSLSVKNVDGRWRLTMTPSSRWLDAAGRTWPVTVDPYVYTEPDQDCSLHQMSPTTSFCGADRLALGTPANTTHGHHTVLRFPGLSQIPKDADVHMGLLTLRAKNGGGQTGQWVQSEARPLTEAFTGQATWNSNDGVDRWSEPGGEAETKAGEGAENKAWIGPGISAANWSVHKMVRDWVAGRRANHGMLLTSPATQYAEFWPSEQPGNTTPTATEVQEPRLQIEYTPRQGARRGWSFEQMQLSDRISLQVNVGSGNLMVRQNDFSMPGGLGPDISVSRTYNSQNVQASRLGPGWTLDTAHDVLLKHWGETLIHQGPTGVTAGYEKHDGATDWKTPVGFDDKLTAEAGDKHKITDNASQTKRWFDSGGRLETIEDRNGRRLKFAYAASGATRATTIKNEADETKVTFAYDGSQRLTGFTDAASRQYVYGFDSFGKLAEYTDPQNGSANKTLYVYGGPHGQLSQVTTPGGKITRIEYYAPGERNAGKVKAVTRVTNTANMTGARTEFTYDQRRDGSGEAEVTDPNGSATADANDRVWRYVFDDQGRVTKTRDPLGRESEQKLTTNSNVQKYTAPGNTGTTPNTEFTYDATTNNMTGSSTITDANVAGGKPMTTSNAYGEAGAFNPAPPAGSQWLPTSSVNEQGRTTTVDYKNSTGDANGNPYAVRDQLGTQNSVTFQYQPVGSAINGKGGQLSGITDARGNQTTYGYDTKGNVNLITPPIPLGTTAITSNANIGRVETVKDGKNQYRFLEYDNLDRLTKIVFSANNVKDTTDEYVQYTYDRDGNKLTEADRDAAAATRTTTWTYDLLNRMTNEALPYGSRSNAYTYDLVGNLKSLTDSGGKTEYTYDAANTARAVYQPGVTRPIKFEHDQRGRRTKVQFPNDVTVENKYDDASRLLETAATHVSAPTTPIQKLQYAYSNQASCTDPAESGTALETTLRTKVVNVVAGRETRYCYDQLSRLRLARTASTGGTWATNPDLATFAYKLDGAGNVLKRTVSGTAATPGTASYGYDAANQMCWSIASDTTPVETGTCPAMPAGAAAYAFDANGNSTTGGATYNLRDQTTSLGSYLGAGQDRRIAEPGGVTLQTNALGLGSSNSTYYTRDDKGAPLSTGAGTTRQYYLTDALGSITALTGTGGAVTRSYAYDPYGQLTATSGTTTDYLRFAGGYTGPGSGGLTHFGQRFYSIAQMRWTQQDPLDQAGDLLEGNRYVYVGANPVNYTDPDGLKIWDGAVRALAGAACTTATALNAGGLPGRVVCAAVGAESLDYWVDEKTDRNLICRESTFC